MSGSVADYEESRKGPREPGDRLSDLRRRVRVSESRIRDLESLLDRILICLNASEGGEGGYSLATVARAIVQDISLHRLLEAGPGAPDA